MSFKRRPRVRRVSSRTFAFNLTMAWSDTFKRAADRKSQKLAFGWAVYRAFQRIHCESQCVTEEALYACHYPLSCTLASDQYIAVIGITRKAVATPFQLPIQFVKHNVGQHRRERPALRDSHRCRFGVLTNTDARFEIAVDEPQQIKVRTTVFEPHHQPVVIDPVEECLQVHVHHPTPALSDARLYMSNRLMGGMPRAKSVAVAVKAGFPLRTDHLRNGLLDEAVQHRGYSQATSLPVRFRDLHAPHSPWPVAARQQLGANGWPVAAEIVWQVINRHAVDARRAFVPAYLL
jgi:hypothetical protein